VHRAPEERAQDERPDLAAAHGRPSGSAPSEQLAKREREVAGAVPGIAVTTTAGHATVDPVGPPLVHLVHW
jgi:hypothetical protein